MSQARAFYAIIAASILVGVAMDFVAVILIGRCTRQRSSTGRGTTSLLVLILLLARSRALLGQHYSGLLSQLLVGAAAVGMAVLSLPAVLP